MPVDSLSSHIFISLKAFVCYRRIGVQLTFIVIRAGRIPKTPAMPAIILTLIICLLAGMPPQQPIDTEHKPDEHQNRPKIGYDGYYHGFLHGLRIACLCQN